MNEVFCVFREIGGGFGPSAEGEKLGPVDVGHEVFVLFPDIEKNAVEAVGEDLAKFERGDFGNGIHGAGRFGIGNWFGDGGLVAAKRAVGIAFDFNFAERGVERAVMDQAAERWIAEACDELDSFHGLQAANDSREHAQDTGFRSCRNGAFWRRFGKEATITGTSEMRREDGDLSFELENSAVNEGFLLKKGRVVGAEAGREIIRPVQDKIVVVEKIEGVVRFELSGVFDDFDVWIDFGKSFPGAGELG